MLDRSIFLELPVDQIEAIRDKALASITSGTVQIGWSVGENSSQKTLSAPPDEILAACRYALKRLAPAKYGAPVNRTIANFS